jgi:toxin YoeB
MAQKQIRWTSRAINDKFDILEYWINRNKSTTFSEKPDELFEKAFNQLPKFPQQGKKTGYRNIRIKIVRSYLIYYLIEDQFITVVRIWEAKRDPKKFKLR